MFLFASYRRVILIEVKSLYIRFNHICVASLFETYLNSAGTDQTLQDPVYDQGIHCVLVAFGIKS